MVFSNISAGSGLFFILISALNFEIETYVLSTIESTNRVNFFLRIVSPNLNICIKKQKLGKTRPDWAKRLFIHISVTPNRVESSEISQTANSLFPSVINLAQLVSLSVALPAELVLLLFPKIISR